MPQPTGLVHMDKPMPHEDMDTPLRPGQPFNPYRMSVGLFIPEGLSRCDWISPGAKLAWGRLKRYAGQNGDCRPAMATLGKGIGVGRRQAQKYVLELERAKLIRRVPRFSGRAQTSNRFEFLWHELFEEGVNDRSGKRVHDNSPLGATNRTPKESQREESHSQEVEDIDCPPTNRKNRDSPVGVSLPSSECRQYPRLREVLYLYMVESPSDQIIYPNDRQVVDVLDAADGATEEEVIQCLLYLYKERGLKPRTKYGPRSYAWFPTVVGDYFTKKREREGAANPCGYDEWADRNATREYNATLKT